MLISTDKLLTVLKKIKQLREEYRAYALAGDANRLSIMDLHRCIGRMYQLEIEMYEVSFEGEYVRGLMERYSGRIVVRVKRDQTDDQKRFTAVKEMCHGVVDEEEDWSVDGVGRIHDLLVEFEVGNGKEAHRATQSEVLAEIAAMEIMYPYECREPDLKKLASGDTTMVKIAAYHGLPVVFVSRALSDQYHQMISRFWAEVNNPH